MVWQPSDETRHLPPPNWSTLEVGAYTSGGPKVRGEIFEDHCAGFFDLEAESMVWAQAELTGDKHCWWGNHTEPLPASDGVHEVDLIMDGAICA